MKRGMILLIGLLVLAACTEQQNNQIPNPAAKFCEDNGGDYEITTAADGSQGGDCVFPNGGRCEGWAFQRGECHVCTDAQKAADACTMEYAPVCGEDGETYGNGCGACSSGNVNTYVNGECPSECGECPQFVPPSPDFCKDGTIVQGEVDECGCQTHPSCVRDNSEIKFYCTDRPDACTKEYVPVCGWFNEDVQCIRYPCANTFGNKCEACSDRMVDYWTEGDCPEDL